MARTVQHVSPGADTIQAAINAANDTTNGDTIILDAGTYTFTPTVGFGCMVFTSGLTGTLFGRLANGEPQLIIQGASRDSVILNIAGYDNYVWYGGDAECVVIKDITITGDTSLTFFRDLVNSTYKDWTFDNIKLDDIAKDVFKFQTQTLWTGLTIKNIVTTANFGGSTTARNHIVYLEGPNSRINLTIDNIDCRLNNGNVERVVYTEDIQFGSIRNIKAYGLWKGAVRCESVGAGGNVNLTIDGIYVDNAWDGVTTPSAANTKFSSAVTEPAVHVGNPATNNTHPSRYVHLSNIVVRNNASYGIEFENDCQSCSLVNFRVYNVNYEGCPLAEETQYITVSDGIIDTVRDVTLGVEGGNGNGLALVHCAYSKVSRVKIMNTPHGIIHTDFERGGTSGGAYPEAALPNFAAAGGWAVRNIGNEISNNTIINCTYPFVVNVDSLADGAHTGASVESSTYAGIWSNNKVYGTFTAYALVIPHEDGSTPAAAAKTQAQFEALFPHTIKASDTVTTGSFPTNTYSTQEALNLMAGSADLHAYSSQAALNIIATSASFPYALSSQVALNQLSQG